MKKKMHIKDKRFVIAVVATTLIVSLSSIAVSAASAYNPGVAPAGLTKPAGINSQGRMEFDGGVVFDSQDIYYLYDVVCK